jgi:hypothetical protein
VNALSFASERPNVHSLFGRPSENALTLSNLTRMGFRKIALFRLQNRARASNNLQIQHECVALVIINMRSKQSERIQKVNRIKLYSQLHWDSYRLPMFWLLQRLPALLFFGPVFLESGPSHATLLLVVDLFR